MKPGELDKREAPDEELSESDRKLDEELEGTKMWDEALPKVFKAASEVPDKMDILNELELSMDDLDEEDLKQFLDVKEGNRDAVEKFRDHMEMQLNYQEWERSAYVKTSKLIEKLPYKEKMLAKKEIAAVRESNQMSPKKFEKLKSKERLFHIRNKNKELNAVMRKYFLTKERERVDFGREEPEKYETKGEQYDRTVRAGRTEGEKYLAPKITGEERSKMERRKIGYQWKEHPTEKRGYRYARIEPFFKRWFRRKKNKAA